MRKPSAVKPTYMDMVAALRGYKRGKVSLKRVTKKIRKFAMAVAYDAAHDAAEGMDRIYAAEGPRAAPDSYSGLIERLVQRANELRDGEGTR